MPGLKCELSFSLVACARGCKFRASCYLSQFSTLRFLCYADARVLGVELLKVELFVLNRYFQLSTFSISTFDKYFVCISLERNTAIGSVCLE